MQKHVALTIFVLHKKNLMSASLDEKTPQTSESEMTRHRRTRQRSCRTMIISEIANRRRRAR